MLHKLTIYNTSVNVRFVEYGFTRTIRERIYHFALETLSNHHRAFQVEKCEKLPLTWENVRKCYRHNREILWNQKPLF